MLDENRINVFRQFIGGMCQKNQLKYGEYVKIFVRLYLKNAR